MQIMMFRTLVTLTCVMLPLFPAMLPQDIISVINESVFEVVVLKPTNDSLTYEKELPLKLLPFSVRNDKYYSIGTAFAVSATKLVSAAHVFSLSEGSQFAAISVRDRSGGVYEIENVGKYASDRDFIMFSIKGKTNDKWLEHNDSPKINDVVYAVGNALGEGIVIRDGLLTSQTPEEINGEWKWLRYSAAASPGNSGGPLLDSEGRVIGIVLRKSPNENLNFALPYGEVTAAPKLTATYKNQLKYVLPNMSKTVTGTCSFTVPLPKTIRSLRGELIAGLTNFTAGQLKKLLADNAAGIFPYGKQSQMLLFSDYSTQFPAIVAEGENGVWDAYSPEKKETFDLGSNGSVKYGAMNSMILISFQKPDTMPLAAVYTNGKAFMDLVLKGIAWNRFVASEKVRVTSLGNPCEEYIHEDRYGRKWIVRIWQLEYCDWKIVTFSLPIPNGTATIMQFGQTGLVDNGIIPDLKVITDFMYISYYGTFAQWREYLAMGRYIPSQFTGLAFSYLPDKSLSCATARVQVSYTTGIFGITDESDMELNMRYFRGRTNAVWDIAGFVFGESRHNKTYFSVNKVLRPEPDLNDSYKSDWKKICRQTHPYGSIPYVNEGNTFIRGVHPVFTASSSNENLPFVYTIFSGSEGEVSKTVMTDRFKSLAKSVNILER